MAWGAKPFPVDAIVVHRLACFSHFLTLSKLIRYLCQVVGQWLGYQRHCFLGLCGVAISTPPEITCLKMVCPPTITPSFLDSMRLTIVGVNPQPSTSIRLSKYSIINFSGSHIPPVLALDTQTTADSSQSACATRRQLCVGFLAYRYSNHDKSHSRKSDWFHSRIFHSAFLTADLSAPTSSANGSKISLTDRHSRTIAPQLSGSLITQIA